ncbi:flagellum-specific ATP synthase FliI [Rhodospirillum rubrum]|uniref:flagellar protein export ATPase FliI n=1 Tax=Rhodospirillum rubrum TaxID=1085 RepID=UPI00190759FA|nr:flagellar protein export ATPase FliI [Rhodospirillum rubrum]MBK1664896.1 flagellum-specific ATP synthase FliI [Rhodospirillum rubrum]MBK1676856.1 flagellum-specific ATP synthase FliI [Rhodospirillum rubrum]
MSAIFSNLLNDLAKLPERRIFGRVVGVQGMLVEIGGAQTNLSVGDRCAVIARDGRPITCEVIGFRAARALLMPFSVLDGVGLGCRAEVIEGVPAIYPTRDWLGRVINAMGEAVDGKGPLPAGERAVTIRGRPPSAHSRQRVGGKLDLGVRAINTFLTCCRGQRMGIFAGSGVGKSSVMSMFIRNTNADVIVMGLVGERGREAREFIEDDLGEEGLKRAVTVVATSDESPLMRRQAAYMTLAVAEYFRDQGLDVLCLMDSVTRFAMAQREISLSAGEPPASKGYTPTVFAELPKLLERAGPGVEGSGSITGLFTVLVEGDDHNEPISDAVRGILDGHIVLDRAIAERGRYPAINILRSVSRTMPGCNSPAENALVAKGRRLIAAYENMAELIRLGAYRKGSDPETDTAIHYHPALDAFLTQAKSEGTDLATGYAMLETALAPQIEMSAPMAAKGFPAPSRSFQPSRSPAPPRKRD